jgi:hypothetical protein
MSDKIIDVPLVEEKIVACPICGQRNRVRKHGRQVAFRCGACAAKLSNPFAVGRLNPKSLFGPLRGFSLSKRRKPLLLFTLLGLIATGFLLLFFNVHGTSRGARQFTTQEAQEILASQRMMMDAADGSRSAFDSLPQYQPVQTNDLGTGTAFPTNIPHLP